MIYLDNSATTRCLPEATEAFRRASEEDYFNVSSPYRAALNTEKKMREDVRTVASFFGARPEELIFTSGGTESDNTALFSCFSPGCEYIVSAVEHHAVLHAVKRLEEMGAVVHIAPVLPSGEVDSGFVFSHINEKTAMVSIMHVNNETGVINPLPALAAGIKERNAKTLFHSDGVQAFLHVPLSMREAGVDFYSVSGHKLHAPKGIGVLYVKSGTPFRPFLYGGGQQENRRSGTVNTPGIAGLAQAWRTLGSAAEFSARLARIKQAYTERLCTVPDTLVHSSAANCAPNVLSVGFAGIRAATLQNALEDSVIIGKGSACTSRSSRISHVLEAMNVPRAYAEGTVRLSFGAFNTVEEADEACEKIIAAVAHLRKFKRK